MLARRCYALVPTALRRRFHQRVPFGQQVRISRWLSRPAGSLGISLRQWYDDRPGRDTGRRWIRLDGRRVSAVVDPEATPLGAHQSNLDRVLVALADASVEHFAIPHHRGLRSRIGVPATQRAEALRAVAGLPDVLIGRPGRPALRPRPGRRRPRRVRRAEVVLVYRPIWAGDDLAYGAAYGCELEFWHGGDGRLTAPRPNALARSVPSYRPNVRVPGASLNPFVPTGYHARYPVRADFAGVSADAVTFPVDAVYTWHDRDDPHWRSRYRAAHDRHGPHGATDEEPRHVDHDALRYSLRSLHMYAPWLRHIYLVTDGQVPRWLDLPQPGLTVVGHRDLFDGDATLPTFNPHAVESVLHLIPGLAEHFLYLDDNVLLGRPVLPRTFFHPNGLTKFFPSRLAQIDLGDPAYTDAPVTAAAKNNRRLIARRFGRVISQRMKHTPYALRRSVLAEICAAAPEEIAETRGHPFRHPADLAIASGLHHHWSYLRGTGVPGPIRHLRADLADPMTPVLLNHLLTWRDHDTFCLDDSIPAGADRDRPDAMQRGFLARYLPVRSPWEVTAEVEATRGHQTATELAHLLQPGVRPGPGPGPVPQARPGQPEPTTLPDEQLQPR